MDGPYMDLPTDAEFLERIKAAILKAGGVAAVAAVTGIPVGTLKKYVAGTSMPSFANAARIAAAADVSIGVIAGLEEEPATKLTMGQAASFALAVFKDVSALSARVYKEEGVKLAAGVSLEENERYTRELIGKLDDLGNMEEAQALLPWLENRIRRELREAAAAPGTGKREAS